MNVNLRFFCISSSFLAIATIVGDANIRRKTHILGHEGVAEIVKVGPTTGPTSFAVRLRVVFWPNNPHDLEDTLGVNTEGLFQRALLISQAALVVNDLPSE